MSLSCNKTPPSFSNTIHTVFISTSIGDYILGATASQYTAISSQHHAEKPDTHEQGGEYVAFISSMVNTSLGLVGVAGHKPSMSKRLGIDKHPHEVMKIP